MTRPGDWRPVQSRGPTHRAPAPSAPRSRNGSEAVVTETALEQPGLANGSSNDHDPAHTCVFCGRPTADATYAWPDWLCRFVAEHEHLWETGPSADRADLVIIERAEIEADKTTTRVCTTCSNGWMQRLEDNVSPFLTSMILGDPTPLPTARRKLLARWAAKTAIVLEGASGSALRTPYPASEHVRRVGAHSGTQVLVGKYDGQRLLLAAERDLSLRTVAGETRHLSQTSLVMGHVLMHVYADPWRDDAPDLTENAVRPFIALIGNRGRTIEWPPAVSIDDALYDLMRLGPATETLAPNGSDALREEPEPAIGNHDRAAEAVAIDLDVTLPAWVWQPPAPPPAPEAPPGPEDGQAAPAPRESTDWRRRRSVYAAAALALVVGASLAGFGLHERADAAAARARSRALFHQTQVLDAQVRLKARQLAASQARLKQLEDGVKP